MGRRKAFTPTSGHKQLLTGSGAAIFGHLMDFDQQFGEMTAKKSRAF
jgi:hypothetical protein